MMFSPKFRSPLLFRADEQELPLVNAGMPPTPLWRGQDRLPSTQSIDLLRGKGAILALGIAMTSRCSMAIG